MNEGVMMILLLLFLAATVSKLVHTQDSEETLRAAGRCLAAVAARVWRPRSSVILLTDGSTSPSTVFTELWKLGASSGMTVFEVAAKGTTSNLTEAQLSQAVAQARKVRQVSWLVMVVVVSDDPTFLAASAEWAIKGHLLLWANRLLAITRRPLSDLRHLHTSFSMMNAMLLILDASSRCSVYVHLPYSPKDAQVLRVATWSTHLGLILDTHFDLYPNKFSRLFYGRHLVVAAEEFPPHVVKDATPRAVGHPLTYTGPLALLLQLLAHSINFTYTFLRPPDGAWGNKQADGSWTGMVGMVYRKEADLGLGPFGVSSGRAEVVDFTRSMLVDYLRIMAGQGRPEVDPWGFLLPLEPPVWIWALATLLVLLLVTFLLGSCPFRRGHARTGRATRNFALYVRVLLQQDTRGPGGRWWERLLMGGWLVVVLVLTRSYSGTLTSTLAVKYIPQPYQTLRALLDDQSIVMVWERGSVYMQYVLGVQSGIFHEVMESQKKGRLMLATTPEYDTVADTLVTKGRHALVIEDLTSRVIMTNHFSRTGRCDFYQSREVFLPAFLCMIGQKGSPLVPAMSNRIKSVTEAGFYGYWMNQLSINSTRCSRPPSTITTTTSLSLANLWGVFVVVAVGHLMGVVTLGLELVATHLLYSQRSLFPVSLSS
nr:probable glutamate receptor [Procambarus clarkii]